MIAKSVIRSSEHSIAGKAVMVVGRPQRVMGGLPKGLRWIQDVM